MISSAASIDISAQKAKNIRRFDYIDALRGFAIFLVIVCHTYQVAMPVYIKPLSMLASMGARGVQLFFLISAFTLYYSKTKRTSQGETSYKSFYIRRYFRLAPMYYLGIIYFIFQGTIASTFWIDENLGVTFWNTLSNLFFINSISPFWINSIVPGGWSISVEFIFYLLFPFIFSKVKSLASSINLLIICFVFQILAGTLLKIYPLVAESQLWNDFLFHYLPNQLPVFCLGIIAFHIIFKSDYDIKKVNKFLICLVLIFLITLWKYITLHHFLVSIGFFLLMILLSKRRLKLFVNRLSVYLGKVSYSAYLLHFVILFFMGRLGWMKLFDSDDYLVSLLNFSIILIITTFVTVAIATITYKYIEKPFIMLGKRFILKLNN